MYNPETQKYAIDSLHTSLLSSLAFIGKFLGCFFAGPAIERFGHRIVFQALSVISIIGVISKFLSLCFYRVMAEIFQSRLLLPILHPELDALHSLSSAGSSSTFLLV
jgi:MFS family permease